MIEVVSLKSKRRQMDKSMGPVRTYHVESNKSHVNCTAIAFSLSHSLSFVSSFLVIIRRPLRCVVQLFFGPFIPLPSVHQDAYNFSNCSHYLFGFIRCCCRSRRAGYTWDLERTVSKPSTDHRTLGGSRSPSRNLQLRYPMRQWRLLQQAQLLWILQRLLWRWLSTQL